MQPHSNFAHRVVSVCCCVCFIRARFFFITTEKTATRYTCNSNKLKNMESHLLSFYYRFRTEWVYTIVSLDSEHFALFLLCRTHWFGLTQRHRKFITICWLWIEWNFEGNRWGFIRILSFFHNLLLVDRADFSPIYVVFFKFHIFQSLWFNYINLFN